MISKFPTTEEPSFHIYIQPRRTQVIFPYSVNRNLYKNTVPSAKTQPHFCQPY